MGLRPLFLFCMITLAQAKSVTYIQTDQIEHDPVKNTLSLSKLNIYYPYKEHPWQITANDAILEASGEMHLKGNITLKEGADELHTPELDINPKTHLIYGEQGIHGTFHHDTIQAQKFALHFPHGDITFPNGLIITHFLPQDTQHKLENMVPMKTR